MKNILLKVNFIILLFFLTFISKSFSNENEIIILELKANNITLSEAIDSYETDKDIFIPIKNILEYLGFFVEYNTLSKKLDTWIFSKDFHISIDELKNIATIKNKQISTKDETINIDYDLYISTKLFQQLFPFFEIKIDKNLMILYIQSDTPLPIEIKKEKQDKWKNIKKQSPNYKQKYNKDIIKNDSLFTIPSFDIYSSYSYNNNTYSDQQYSLGVQSILLGFNSNIYMSTNNLEKINSKRIILKQYNEENNILGFAKNIEMGDITIQEEPLIYNGSYGLGFSLSTFDDNYEGTNSIQISGELKDGWEVELSRNGVLLDFIKESNNGSYRFENVSTFYGLNIFKLKFYGPFGEIIEEEKKIYIDNNFKKKGSFDLKISAIKEEETSNNYFKNENIANNPIKYNVNFENGLSSLMTLTGGVVFSSHTNSANYGRIGIKRSIFGGLFKTNIAVNDKDSGFGTNINLDTNFKNYNFSIEHNQFEEFQSEKTIFYGKDIQHFSILKINKPINTFPFNYIPINITTKQYHAIDNTNYFENSIRFSRNIFKKNNFSLTLNRNKNFYKTTFSDARLLLNTKIGKFNIKGDAYYDLNYPNKLKTVSLSNNINYKKQGNIQLKWDKTFLNSNYEVYSIGINKYLNFGSIGINSQYNSQDIYNIFLSISTNLSYDYKKNIFLLKEKKYADYGKVLIRVFIDKNFNGTFDKGELLVENIKFRSNAGAFNDKTNKKGIALLYGIPTNKEIKLWMDTNSLDEFYLKPNKNSISIFCRPGDILKIDFPLIESGDIEGFLNILENDDLEPLKNTEILLIDKNDKIIQKIYSEFDGYFIFEQIPVGEYKIKLANDKFLDYIFSESKKSSLKINLKSNEQIHSLENIIIKPNKNLEKSKSKVKKQDFMEYVLADDINLKFNEKEDIKNINFKN